MRRPRRRTPRAPARRAECVLPRRLLEQYHGLRETGEGAWRYAVARTAAPQEGVGRVAACDRRCRPAHKKPPSAGALGGKNARTRRVLRSPRQLEAVDRKG